MCYSSLTYFCFRSELDAVYMAQLHHYAAMSANAAAVAASRSSPFMPPTSRPSTSLLPPLPGAPAPRPPSAGAHPLLPHLPYSAQPHRIGGATAEEAAAKQRLAAGGNLKVPGVRMPQLSAGTRDHPIDVIDPDEIKVIHEVKKSTHLPTTSIPVTKSVHMANSLPNYTTTRTATITTSVTRLFIYSKSSCFWSII